MKQALIEDKSQTKNKYYPKATPDTFVDDNYHEKYQELENFSKFLF